MANDDAVRKYLLAITNPAALKDEQRLSELDAAIESATDPLEELKLLAEQLRLAEVRPADYEQGFVEHAKAWAEENDVPADVFKAQGVSADVLQRAGLIASSSPAKKGTRTRVSRDDVVACIRSFGEPFKLSQVEDATGASMATIRKVVSDLESQGTVTNQGEDTHHAGRGRPATIYTVKR
jgi:hypothetical protein